MMAAGFLLLLEPLLLLCVELVADYVRGVIVCFYNTALLHILNQPPGDTS